MTSGTQAPAQTSARTSSTHGGTSRAVELDAGDLTPGGEAWCPNPKSGIQAWSGHPRVFLNLSEGEAKCPYCGTVYRLKTAKAGQPA